MLTTKCTNSINTITNRINLQDLIFLVVFSVVTGIIWMLYGLLFNFVHPALAALNLTGITKGIWNVSGGFFGLVLRKHYSAFLGDLLPSIVEMNFSSWGLYNLLYGTAQGMVAELGFRVYGYSRSTFKSMVIINFAVSFSSFWLDYIFFNLYKLSITANLFRITTDLLSTFIFSLLNILLIQYLLKLGYLKPYAISAYRRCY